MSRTNWRRLNDEDGAFFANRDRYALTVWGDDDGGYYWQTACPDGQFFDGTTAKCREAKFAATRCYQMMRFQEVNRVR